MTREEIVTDVNKILAVQFELKPSSLNDPEAKLKDDLGLDSLDAVDIVVTMEKKFGCRIKEADARAVSTLNQLYDCINRLKNP